MKTFRTEHADKIKIAVEHGWVHDDGEGMPMPIDDLSFKGFNMACAAFRYKPMDLAEIEKVYTIPTVERPFRFCSKECVLKSQRTGQPCGPYLKHGEATCHGTGCGKPAIFYSTNFVYDDYNREGFDLTGDLSRCVCGAKPEVLEIGGGQYMRNEGDWMRKPVCPNCRKGNGRFPEGEDD